MVVDKPAGAIDDEEFADDEDDKGIHLSYTYISISILPAICLF